VGGTHSKRGKGRERIFASGSALKVNTFIPSFEIGGV